jgi:hypothetical protein
MHRLHIAGGLILGIAALIVAAHTRDSGGRPDRPIPGVALFADGGVHSIALSWSHNGASRYNVYLSSRPGCDIADYARCPDGRMFADVRSPLTIDALVNGHAYYATVEGIHARGRSVSNEAGARPASLARGESAR